MLRKILNKKFLVIFLGMGITVLIFVIGNIISNYETSVQSYNATIEKMINDIVPTEATDVKFADYYAFQSARFRLRFTIPSAVLPNFVEDFCPDMNMIDGGCISIYNDEKFDWWKPEDAEVYTMGSCIRDNIEVFRVLIDRTNIDSYVVYIRG